MLTVVVRPYGHALGTPSVCGGGSAVQCAAACRMSCREELYGEGHCRCTPAMLSVAAAVRWTCFRPASRRPRHLDRSSCGCNQKRPATRRAGWLAHLRATPRTSAPFVSGGSAVDVPSLASSSAVLVLTFVAQVVRRRGDGRSGGRHCRGRYPGCRYGAGRYRGGRRRRGGGHPRRNSSTYQGPAPCRREWPGRPVCGGRADWSAPHFGLTGPRTESGSDGRRGHGGGAARTGRTRRPFKPAGHLLGCGPGPWRAVVGELLRYPGCSRAGGDGTPSTCCCTTASELAPRNRGQPVSSSYSTPPMEMAGS